MFYFCGLDNDSTINLRGGKRRFFELFTSMHVNGFRVKIVQYNRQFFKNFFCAHKNEFSIVFDERYLILGIFLKIKGVKLIFCPRGNKLRNYQFSYGRYKLEVYRFIFAFLYSFCDKIIFQTYAQRQEFQQLFGHFDDYGVVPNNVNASWMTQNNFFINFSEKPKFMKVGFLGGDLKIKGFKLLFDAIQILKNKYNFHIELLVGGTFKDPPKSENVTFFGHVNNVEKFLTNVDFLVVPSLYDSFPNTILEALSVNTPVIAAETPMINEIFKGGEVLVFKQDRFKLAEKIYQLYNYEHTWGEAINACKMLKERYSFNWTKLMMSEITS